MAGSRWVRLAKLSGAVGLLALAVTGCSPQQTVENSLRLGWPRGITDQAEHMRRLWTWSTLTALLVGALVWGLIFWAVIFYRKRHDGLPKQTKYNLPIETIYTIIPFLMIAVLFYYTAITQSFVDRTSATPDTTVRVVAFKWNWQFDYLDKTDSISPGAGTPVNTIGSSNEIPIMVLPVDEKIKIQVVSSDVIHSFWVPEFLFKRDVIPGRSSDFEITIKKDQKGAFVGRCAELCGTYHAMMNFEVRAVSAEDYQKYLNKLAELGNSDVNRQAKALSAIGQAPQATTTHPFDTKTTKRSASEALHTTVGH